jgi:WhiB family redox-sensing transcriptional regulator
MSIRTGWRDDAACRGAGTAAFFSRDPLAEAAAVRVCHGCPVMAECREWALAHETLVPLNDQFGVWGGLTHEQRRAALGAAS